MLKNLEIPEWVDNDHIFEWRELLKRTLLNERGYRSDLSGRLLLYSGCHLHEGILSRANVPKSVVWSYRIFHSVNCFLLTPDEHIPQPPSRAWCIEKAYARYGRETVRAWYYSLPFRSFPFQLP